MSWSEYWPPRLLEWRKATWRSHKNFFLKSNVNLAWNSRQESVANENVASSCAFKKSLYAYCEFIISSLRSWRPRGFYYARYYLFDLLSIILEKDLGQLVYSLSIGDSYIWPMFERGGSLYVVHNSFYIKFLLFSTLYDIFYITFLIFHSCFSYPNTSFSPFDRL